MNRFKRVESLIHEVYKLSPSGGYGHVVFDDDNVDDSTIEWCIQEAKKGEYDLSEEVRIASIIALSAFYMLPIEEREMVVERYRYAL